MNENTRRLYESVLDFFLDETAKIEQQRIDRPTIFVTMMKIIQDIAEEFHKAGTVDDKMICMEIIKGLRKQIQERSISARTIHDALESKYKQIEFGPHGIAESATYDKKEDDVLSKEIHLLEETAGLTIKQIFGMEVGEFLAPYLLNKRRLSYEESFNIINEWLVKCSKLEMLDFNAKAKIKEGLYGVQKKGYFPIRRQMKTLEDTFNSSSQLQQPI